MPSNSGINIDNKTGLHEQIQLDAITLHQLVEVSELLYQETDLEKIPEILLNMIQQILKVDSVALFVFDPEKRKYITFKNNGDLSLHPSGQLFEEIVQNVKRRPIIINSDGKYRFPPNFCSGIIFPLNRYINQHYLWVERSSDTTWPLSTNDLDVMTIIVHQGMVAMENIMLAHRLKGIPTRSYWGENGITDSFRTNQKSTPNTHSIFEKNPSGYSPKSRQAKIQLGNEICFDPGHQTLGCKDGKVNLTPAETKLLCVLYYVNYQVVNHEDLVYLMQGYKTDREGAARILRPLICRLKKKFELFSGGDRWIQNIRGNGYCLDIQQANKKSLPS